MFIIESWNPRHYKNKTFHELNPNVLISLLNQNKYQIVIVPHNQQLTTVPNNQQIVTAPNSNMDRSSDIIDVTCNNANEFSAPTEIDNTDMISYIELHNTASE